MNESKTPITDSAKYQRCDCGTRDRDGVKRDSIVVPSYISEQLETELNEALAKIASLESDARCQKLSSHKIMVLQSRAEKAEAELAEIKRQMQEGPMEEKVGASPESF